MFRGQNGNINNNLLPNCPPEGLYPGIPEAFFEMSLSPDSSFSLHTDYGNLCSLPSGTPICPSMKPVSSDSNYISMSHHQPP